MKYFIAELSMKLYTYAKNTYFIYQKHMLTVVA